MGTPGRGRHRGSLCGDDPGWGALQRREQAGAWPPAPAGLAVLPGNLPGAAAAVAGELSPQPAPREGVWMSALGGRTPGPGWLLASALKPRPAPPGGLSPPCPAPGDSHG